MKTPFKFHRIDQKIAFQAGTMVAKWMGDKYYPSIPVNQIAVYHKGSMAKYDWISAN
jgi:hypothetical protein